MMGGGSSGGSTTAVNGILSVPRINVRNNTLTGSTPLKLNNSRFRHIYENTSSSIL